ncbi:hypothetical protein KJ973_02100 [Patescibacteria group bacterium]|nr:hypothetical protein [Patescibacteria group bacterium]MBU1246868.1 hypothetical protein [Patescibacteria group bacterium]MBU1519461.1 hypothetical protein [Patescibacteria group bacterium]MBU1956391.1 hypothetical protein [Patescibacteria group bacterium]MBU2010005.1 hypothetical protein [Patescibacteria group bacterium]
MSMVRCWFVVGGLFSIIILMGARLPSLNLNLSLPRPGLGKLALANCLWDGLNGYLYGYLYGFFLVQGLTLDFDGSSASFISFISFIDLWLLFIFEPVLFTGAFFV